MAFNNTLTIGAETFERLDNGKWILSTSTADEPLILEVKSTIRPDGVSEYVLKQTMNKNSSTAGAKDDQLIAYTVMRLPLKAFTQAQLEARLASNNTFLSSANITKILRGER